jgi:hypothetical protein
LEVSAMREGPNLPQSVRPRAIEIASALRVELGADLRKAAARYDAIVSEIVLQETAVLRQLKRMIMGLERYGRLRGMDL